MIRLALAGGSDGRPPNDKPRKAQIIRFPRGRRIPSQDEPSMPTVDRSPPVQGDRDTLIPSASPGERSSGAWPRVFPGL
jgi:hypothetical protein